MMRLFFRRRLSLRHYVWNINRRKSILGTFEEHVRIQNGYRWFGKLKGTTLKSQITEQHNPPNQRYPYNYSLGGPGEAPGGCFWTFLGRPSRDLKNELLFVVFSHIWSLFSVLLICPLLSSLLLGWRRRAYAKNWNCIGFCGSQATCALFWQRPKQSTFRGDA